MTMTERETTRAYAQRRANETGQIYDAWQIPGETTMAAAYRCRLNAKTYTECGYTLVASFRPEPRP